MTSRTLAVGFILLMVCCIQQSKAQLVPGRCRCVRTSSKAYSWKRIEQFSITAPISLCTVSEIIVTLRSVNSKTKKNEEHCISPNIYQAKRLQDCWNRVNKDGKRATVMLSECGIL